MWTGKGFTEDEITVLNFFQDYGIKDRAALAVLMGNVKQESKFITNICEGGTRPGYSGCHRGGFGLMHPIRKMDVPAGRSRWGRSMVGPVSDQASVICKKGIFMSLWSFITSVPLTVCEDSKELNSRFRGRQPRDPPRLMTSSLPSGISLASPRWPC